MAPRPARILEITSYPPPRAGWGVRVEYLKRALEAAGDECVVLNLGTSRKTPSPEYETVMDGVDYVRKVVRFVRRGFDVHMHANGESPKGFVLSVLAALISSLWGRRYVLTFHAGVDQVYFPRPKSPALLPVYKYLFWRSNVIVCNSKAVKEKIVEYGVSPDKVVPIPAFSRQYVEFARVPLGDDVERFYHRFRDVLFTYIRIRDGFYLDTLLDGFADLARRRPETGLAFCGVSGDVDPALLSDCTARMARLGIEDRVCVIDDLDHDQFLTALTRSSLYLRTPTSDGVASSVLEALALRIPVVAAENGTRPPGVVTYDAASPESLAETVDRVLANRDDVIDAITPPVIEDTVAVEVALLTGR